jgi:hypothetical protein
MRLRCARRRLQVDVLRLRDERQHLAASGAELQWAASPAMDEMSCGDFLDSTGVPSSQCFFTDRCAIQRIASSEPDAASARMPRRAARRSVYRSRRGA